MSTNQNETPTLNGVPINADVLSFIFQFLTFKELKDTMPKISKIWCEAATKTEDAYWRDPNHVITFNNVMFDAHTGDVIVDFNNIEFVTTVFAHILKSDLSSSQGRQSLLYTGIPFEFQNLDVVTPKKNCRQSSRVPPDPSHSTPIRVSIGNQNDDLANGNNQSTNNENVDDRLTKVKTHLFPVAPSDMSGELSFDHTNYSFMYLHDGRFVYILLGNNLACFDLVSMSQRWHTNLYDKRMPKFLFINIFTQNKKYIYVGLPQDVFCIEKKRGTKFNLMHMLPPAVSPTDNYGMITSMNKTSIKKRERVKDLEVDDQLVVVVTGDNLIINTTIDFGDLNAYCKHHMAIQKEKIQKEASSTQPSSPNSGPTSGLFSNFQLSRKKTLMNIGLDAPKLLIFDGDNNFITSAICKNKDRHNILLKKATGSLHPYFCLINDYERELRVVSAEGKRIHILNLPSRDEQNNANEPINFTYQGKRFMLQGEYGSEKWWLIHPESGRVVDLSYMNVKHDRLFVIETADGHLLGLLSLNVKSKKISYWEQEEDSSASSTSSENKTNNDAIRKFYQKWSSEMLWKESFYKFELDGACRFYYDKKRRYFIITRTASDSRRFLSKEQRLDIEISVYQSDGGKLLWKKQVECYSGNDPYAEKGFHIRTNDKQLFVLSYFIPISPKKRNSTSTPASPNSPSSPATPSGTGNGSGGSSSGVSLITAYNMQTGALDFTHKHKRKIDLFEQIYASLIPPNAARRNTIVESSVDLSEFTDKSSSDASVSQDQKTMKANSKDKKEKCNVQ